MSTQPPGLPDFRQEYRAAVDNAGYYGAAPSPGNVFPETQQGAPRPLVTVTRPPSAYAVSPMRMVNQPVPRAPTLADVRMPIDYGMLQGAAMLQYRNYLKDYLSGQAAQAAQMAQGNAMYLPQTLQGNAAPPVAPTTQAAGQTYSGNGYSNAQSSGSAGVDPVWYNQFMREHGGATPEEVYHKDGNYALQHALADKAWGDWFYQAMGRPPSAEDWRVSYRQRQDDYYGSF